MADNTPALQGPLLLITQLELVTPTTVAGTLYGIAFTLFCLYVHSLVPRLRDDDRKKQAKFMLGYTIVIMLCGLYNLVSNAWITQDAYIMHGDYPGGPYVYIASTFHTRPASAVSLTCQLAIDTLTSAIQIWRLWVIWSATRFAKLVIVLPLLCFLTFFVPDPSIPSSQAETLAAKSFSPNAYPKNIKKITPTDSPVYPTFGRTASNASSTRGRPGGGGGSSRSGTPPTPSSSKSTTTPSDRSDSP
ncbi:hypothetical protein AGABI2DRAFT_121428 [Agaricus bisporus var. bisporus H97]|uniref:hypothetical protein n=1 Tax=Agaricus bisporus var. bisporus (strain H97 / ATCC MYA-4626 / FGSC 10389) TaxID=936046 RepID=UPI00029F5138|nr:hypothetical protein AGABI2DRAFT_121428 [Agaricus bisporus var. bisporus H97]EKV44250.1 hypothetical protein AGABI2DRAFT_121428 [Agaricus bisporus var. bisporus H97]